MPTCPDKGDYGNYFVKLAGNGASLRVADYFTMSNEVIGAAEDGNRRVVNRDSANNIWQDLYNSNQATGARAARSGQ
jgi:hypothetical protein